MILTSLCHCTDAAPSFHTSMGILASLCNMVIKTEIEKALWTVLNCYNNLP